MASRAGWLDRDGAWYPCLPYGHDRLADQLGTTSPELGRAGWIRVLGAPDEWPGSPNWLLDRCDFTPGFRAFLRPFEAQRAWLLAEGHFLPDDD